MTISYVITCDIGINSMHKYIHPDLKNTNIYIKKKVKNPLIY
jgi:hypothetical protein